MSKKIFGCLLLFSMFFMLPAFAEEEFIDVAQEDWFYTEVTAARKYNLVNGYSDGTFRPHDSLKNSEALKISVLSTMTLDNHNGSSWIAPYIDVGNKVGIISDNFNDIQNIPINRYDFLQYIYYLLLYKYEAAPLESVSKYFDDFNNEVTTFMYDAKILNGVLGEDGLRCSPFSPLSRAEAICIANRTIDYIFNVNKAPYLVSVAENPMTDEEINNVYKYMAFEGLTDITFYYPLDVDYLTLTNTYKAKYNEVRARHYNYFQDLDTARFMVKKNSKNIIIEISLAPTEGYPQNTEFFFAKCEEINQSLWNSGILSLDMTQYEMAEQIFAYICKSYSYKECSEQISIGQGWKMLQNGFGVCSGYDSIFNTLCKLNGIKTIGVSAVVAGTHHIYSKCILDGNVYYADPTWGDPFPDKGPDYCNHEWFGFGVEKLLQSGRKEGGVINEKFDIGAGFRVLETVIQLSDEQPGED